MIWHNPLKAKPTPNPTENAEIISKFLKVLYPNTIEKE